MLVILAGCQGAGGARPYSGPPSAAPTSAIPAVPPPTRAILSDADVGIVRSFGRDHVTAEEAAAAQPDQVLALTEFSGWGWADAATRRWGAIAETLVLTLRPEGGQRAFAFWSRDADRPPFAAGQCPPALSGLDQCRLGLDGERGIAVGRRDTEVFRLECPASQVERLASIQAAHLRG